MQKRVTLKSRSQTPFKVLAVQTAPPFEAAWHQPPSGISAEVVVSVTGEQVGNYEGTLLITTDRPDEDHFTVSLQGKLRAQAPIFHAPVTASSFGTVFVGEIKGITRTFTLQNLGTEDLFMNPSRSGDGLKSILPVARLLPGATTELTLSGDLGDRTGPVDLSQSLTANDSSNPLVTFHITGEILPHWKVIPEEVHFQNLQPFQPESKYLRVIQYFHDWEKPTELLSSPPSGKMITFTVEKTTVSYGQVGYGSAETEVLLTINPDDRAGRWRTHADLLTKETGSAPPPSVRVVWDILGDIRSRPSILVLNQPQKPVPLRIFSKTGKDFSIKNIHLPDGVTLREVGKKTAEYQYEVQALRHEIQGSIYFDLDLPKQRQLDVDVDSPLEKPDGLK
jgi:hypothetical protein